MTLLRSRGDAAEGLAMDEDYYDWGPELHDAAIAHLEAVIEAEWLQEEAGEDFDIDSPACGPYDGCTTCTVREVLFGAYPVIRRMVQMAAAGPTDLTVEALEPSPAAHPPRA